MKPIVIVSGRMKREEKCEYGGWHMNNCRTPKAMSLTSILETHQWGSSWVCGVVSPFDLRPPPPRHCSCVVVTQSALCLLCSSTYYLEHPHCCHLLQAHGRRPMENYSAVFIRTGADTVCRWASSLSRSEERYSIFIIDYFFCIGFTLLAAASTAVMMYVIVVSTMLCLVSTLLY
jgi:hypothetical protein